MSCPVGGFFAPAACPGFEALLRGVAVRVGEAITPVCVTRVGRGRVRT